MTLMPTEVFWLLVIAGIIVAVVTAGFTLNHHYGEDQRWSRMNWWVRAPLLLAWFILPWIGYLLILVPWQAISIAFPPREDESARITRFDPQGVPPAVEKP